MNVDAIFVISLDKAEERREKMREWYPNVNLQFFIVKKNKRNPTRGCYSSHQKVIRYAKEKKLNRILIFEDDAYAMFDWNKIVHITNDALNYIDKTNSNWKYLMLGYLPFKTKKTKNPNILEVLCAADAHAYIVNLSKIRSIPWNGIPIDDFLFCNRKTPKTTGNFIHKKDKDDIYATKPMLFTQKTDQSYIDPTHLWQKGFIDFFGGEQKITDYSNDVNTLILIIFIPIWIILSLILLVLLCLNQKTKKYETSIKVFIGLILISLLVFIILNCTYI